MNIFKTPRASSNSGRGAWEEAKRDFEEDLVQELLKTDDVDRLVSLIVQKHERLSTPLREGPFLRDVKSKASIKTLSEYQRNVSLFRQPQKSSKALYSPPPLHNNTVGDSCHTLKDDPFRSQSTGIKPTVWKDTYNTPSRFSPSVKLRDQPYKSTQGLLDSGYHKAPEKYPSGDDPYSSELGRGSHNLNLMKQFEAHEDHPMLSGNLDSGFRGQQVSSQGLHTSLDYPAQSEKTGNSLDFPWIPTPNKFDDLSEGLEDPLKGRISHQLQLLRNYRELANICTQMSDPKDHKLSVSDSPERHDTLLTGTPSNILKNDNRMNITLGSKGDSTPGLTQTGLATQDNRIRYPLANNLVNPYKSEIGKNDHVDSKRPNSKESEGHHTIRLDKMILMPPPPSPGSNFRNSQTPSTPCASINVPIARSSPKSSRFLSPSRNQWYNYDNSPTATTEEAGTSFGEEAEEEDVYAAEFLNESLSNSAIQPPQIIEREQHRRIYTSEDPNRDKGQQSDLNSRLFLGDSSSNTKAPPDSSTLLPPDTRPKPQSCSDSQAKILNTKEEPITDATDTQKNLQSFTCANLDEKDESTVNQDQGALLVSDKGIKPLSPQIEVGVDATNHDQSSKPASKGAPSHLERSKLNSLRSSANTEPSSLEYQTSSWRNRTPEKNLWSFSTKLEGDDDDDDGPHNAQLRTRKPNSLSNTPMTAWEPQLGEDADHGNLRAAPSRRTWHDDVGLSERSSPYGFSSRRSLSSPNPVQGPYAVVRQWAPPPTARPRPRPRPHSVATANNAGVFEPHRPVRQPPSHLHPQSHLQPPSHLQPEFRFPHPSQRASSARRSEGVVAYGSPRVEPPGALRTKGPTPQPQPGPGQKSPPPGLPRPTTRQSGVVGGPDSGPMGSHPQPSPGSEDKSSANPLLNLLRSGILYASLLKKNPHAANPDNSASPKEMLEKGKPTLPSGKKQETPRQGAGSVVSDVIRASSKSKSIVWKSGSADSVPRCDSKTTNSTAKNPIGVKHNASPQLLGATMKHSPNSSQAQKLSGVVGMAPPTRDASASQWKPVALPHQNTVATPEAVNSNRVRLNFLSHSSLPPSSSASMLAQRFAIVGSNPPKGN